MRPEQSLRDRLDDALGAEALTLESVVDVVARGRAAARRRTRRRAVGGGAAVVLVVAGSVGLVATRAGTGAVDATGSGPPLIRALRSDGDVLVAPGVGVRCTRDRAGAQVLMITNIPAEESGADPEENYVRIAFYVDRVEPGQVVTLPTPDTSTPEGAADLVVDLGFFEAEDRPPPVPSSGSGNPEYFSSIAGASGTVRINDFECGGTPSADLDLDVVLQAEQDVPLTVGIRQELAVDRPPLAD